VIEPIGWLRAAVIWGYAIAWMLILNVIKVFVYRTFLDKVSSEGQTEASAN